MLMPKRVKYRRVQRGRLKGKATRGNTIAYGEYGLVALEPAWITSNQIEAARIAMTRYIKRGGKVWIKIFPDKPITEKPAETRMHGAADCHLNGTAERHALFQLCSDILGNKLRINIRVLHLNNINRNIFAQHSLTLLTKFFDSCAAPANNHTWLGTVDVNAYTFCVAFNFNFRHSSRIQVALKELTEFIVFNESQS